MAFKFASVILCIITVYELYYLFKTKRAKAT